MGTRHPPKLRHLGRPHRPRTPPNPRRGGRSMTTYTYKKKWLLDRELGRRRTVPAQPVRDHIHQLREHGWTLRGIADAAQLGPTTTHVIAHGTQTTVRALTAQRILALRPESINTRPNQDGFVPATGTRRRIRALLALGWPHTELHARSGVRTSVTLNPAGEWVSRARADALPALSTALALAPSPPPPPRTASSPPPPPAAASAPSSPSAGPTPNYTPDPASAPPSPSTKPANGSPAPPQTPSQPSTTTSP